MGIKIKNLRISRYLDKYSLLEGSQHGFCKMKFRLTDTSGVLWKNQQMCGLGRFSRCSLWRLL